MADVLLLKATTPQSVPALVDAQNFLLDFIKSHPGANVCVAGHSLGGAEAEAAAQAVMNKDRIAIHGATFGATGLPGNTGVGDPNLTDYVIDGDPIGNYATGGHQSAVTIASGGLDTVSSGGSVLGATVRSGGTLNYGDAMLNSSPSSLSARARGFGPRFSGAGVPLVSAPSRG